MSWLHRANAAGLRTAHRPETAGVVATVESEAGTEHVRHEGECGVGSWPERGFLPGRYGTFV